MFFSNISLCRFSRPYNWMIQLLSSTPSPSSRKESKYISATPWCTCFPPRAISTQVRLVQAQVLERSQWSVVQLQLKSPLSKSKSPSPTWLCPVGLGDLDLSRPSSPPPAVGLIPKFAPSHFNMFWVDFRGIALHFT